MEFCDILKNLPVNMQLGNHINTFLRFHTFEHEDLSTYGFNRNTSHLVVLYLRKDFLTFLIISHAHRDRVCTWL